MKRVITILLLILLFAIPVSAQGSEEYAVRNAGDLVSLCGRDASAADYVAAQNFCQGYTVGAFAYYRSVTDAEPDSKFVCVKAPYPDRQKVLADFVAWAKKNESLMQEPAVDTFFRYLAGVFPCK